MSKNLVFGFTSSKRHSLPSLFIGLELQRALLINISKLLWNKSGNGKKKMFFYEGNKKFIQHFAGKKSFSGLIGVNGLHTKTFFLLNVL